MVRDSLLLAPYPQAMSPAPAQLLQFLGFDPIDVADREQLAAESPPLALMLFQVGPREPALNLLETCRARWPPAAGCESGAWFPLRLPGACDPPPRPHSTRPAPR